MKKNLLMIFVKNPQLGTVKTRLAATIGEENALKIYHHLLSHTHRISSPLQCHKAVFYSSFIDRDDRWRNDHYEKFLQTGDDLGERMYNAFDKGFILGYR